MPDFKILLGDFLDISKTIESNSIDLIFADPPFNIGINYEGYSDNLKYSEYVNWSKLWITECYRLLKNTGSIYICINDEYVAELNLILKNTGFWFRNWIIWYYKFGQNQQHKFNRTHTHILYFTKNKSDFIFNSDTIRIPSDRQSKYNDKRANPKGKIPDDVWQIPRVCGTFKQRIPGHPCQMPEEILERIILTSSNVNDVILDPFGGSGTTAVVSKRLNRNFIIIEKSEQYYNIIKQRLYKI